MTFAGYRDAVLIGEGGLGRVYRAVRESTGGVVAIKELHEVPSASPVWHRAKRELEAMLRLKGHPYVVSVEEIFESPAGPCLVMEYLEGGALMQWIERRGPLSTPETVLVGVQVTQALAAAHEVGVVHRDIKPHNLLVGSFGQVKVADFGIAALTRQSGLHTRTQAFTLAYASPEELDGDTVGPPADVFSFSATMAHMATGKRPSFRDRSTTRDLVELEQQRPAIAQLIGALRQCLADDPAQRPTMPQLHEVFAVTAARLGPAAITALAVSPADAPTAFRPSPSAPLTPPPLPASGPTGLHPTIGATPTPSGRPVDAAAPTRKEHRSRGPVVIAAATSALLLAGGAIVVFGRDEAGTESTASTVPASSVNEATTAATESTATSTTIDLSQIFPSTTAATGASGASAGQLVTSLSGQHTKTQLSATYSPQGTYIATTSRDATTVIWTSDGAYVRTLIGHVDEVNSAVFSADESQVLTASADGYAILWDVASGSILRKYPHGDNVYSAEFSSDGSKVITAGGDTRAVVWTIGGSQVMELVTNSGDVLHAEFSRDGSRILTTGTSGDARLYTSDGSPIFPNFTGINHHASWGVFSPDGQYVLVATGHDNGAELWTIGHEYVRTYSGQTGQANMAVFSPDGSQVLVASSDGSAMLFDFDGTPLKTFAQGDIVRAATFSPDGQRVITAGDADTAKIWRV